MHIGILTQYYPPEMGAAQSRLSDLALQLRRRGHEVVVLTAMPNYPHGRILDGYHGLYRREERPEGDVIRAWIWPSASRHPLPRMLSYLSFTISAALTGAVCLPRLDILITESPPLTLGPTGWLLSKLKRARAVFNVSDLWPESAVTLGMLSPNARSTRFAYRLEAFSYRHSWRVSGQSNEIIESVERRFPGVRTVPLLGGVDTERFDPVLRSTAVRHRVLGDEPVIAVYAGLHGLAQGLDLVLDAAEILRDVPGLAIVLIGDGPVKRALVRDAEARGLRNIRFVEAIGRDDVPSVLASADIAIVPLGFRLPGAVPSKLYEAMASGVPVVLVAEGEPADILDAAAGGLAVKPGDASGLAAALEHLASSSPLRESLGAAGRTAAVAKHDRRVSCDRFIDALEEGR